MSVQRHPYADHPAALILADHQPECVTKATPPAAPVSCCCGVMVAWCDFSAHQTGMLQQARAAGAHRCARRGLDVSAERAAQVLADHTFSYSSMDHGDHCACGTAGPDHAAHQADVLARAGLLADGPPPETPTARVLAERADRRTT